MADTFLLVHGAWYGGWCYNRVATILRSAGHRVLTPTLTGLGERSHLYSRSINLTTHITDILNVVRWENLDSFVLVGHSYGGMVVTGVADAIADRITALMYLDAFLPRDGQSLHDLLPPDHVEAQLRTATHTNDFAVAPIPAAAFNVNEADRDWVDSQCTPQPLGTLTEQLRLTGAIERIRRREYVLATTDTGIFKRFHDSIDGDPRWRTHQLPCGHNVMIDLPRETAALIAGAARE